MGTRALFRKIQEKKGLVAGLALFVAVAAGAGVYFGLAHRKAADHAPPGADAKAAAEPVAHVAGPGLTERLSTAIVDGARGIQAKLERIREAEVEASRLRLETAALRAKVENLQFDCQTRSAHERTLDFEKQLTRETGARVGRNLASIQYRPPTHLLPPQLLTLGASYFKAHEDEKAAVIFTYLTGMEENDAYKTPRNFLLAGVSWYRIDNFDASDQYFARVLEMREGEGLLKYQAQARLWRGLAADRMNKQANSQYWLRELVDHHPHSVEAQWINSLKEVSRGPRQPAESSREAREQPKPEALERTSPEADDAPAEDEPD